MRAVTWHGKQDVRVERVPDPTPLNARDAIIRVGLTAICGSDLHLYDNMIPSMMPGDILGHEFLGEVVETGREVGNLKKGDRVVVPFPIACGRCFFCSEKLFAACDNTNTKPWMQEKLYGQAGAGIFGYSHMLGGYAGGQAEYVRVPFADVGPLKLPSSVTDEQALFLSDILPTGWQAAEQCVIQPGQTIAVWGAGPVGLFTMLSAQLLGAERVIAIDRFADRLALAQTHCGAEVVDYSKVDVIETLVEMTGGRGPDACIDAVGMESHGYGLMPRMDALKTAVRIETDRPHVLRQCILACRKGGTVSIPGVYGGFIDKVPMGAAFGKGLTFKMGQTHVHKYLPMLLEWIESGDIDPTFLITHRASLDEAPRMYDTFLKKQDGCVKVVMRP
jgi:threonine dehydrogenase-like Zn-dependent dehydrogenase